MNKHRKFDKLGLFYILALSGIALSIIISQVLVQNFISKQQDDSRTINVAGRQRMLSQKICKIALKIGQIEDTLELISTANELKEAVDLWKKSHRALLNGDESIGVAGDPSPEVLQMYEKITPHYAEIVSNAEKITRSILTTSRVEDMRNYIAAILEHEESFLSGMDDIVFQYDKEANAKVQQLKKIELSLLTLSISIILIELVFIFRPIARNVRQTVNELIESEEGSIRIASELSRLYEEIVKSYQDLEATKYEPGTPLVFASINAHGDFTFLSNKFRDLMEWEPAQVPASFVGLLIKNEYPGEFVEGLMKMLKKHQAWTGEIKLTNDAGDFIWLELFVIPVMINGQRDFKIIARDTTELKEAKMRSREINREKIEKRVKEQQYRSLLILEGQEEERKRLGREIHDGIGQMLTALKLSLESITPSSSAHTKRRLEETRELMKSILKEVRRISFNLTPTSLDDFGIVPAVRKFCQEVNNLSNTEVSFRNETRFVNRLDSHIENNIYRVIQEAVNNAIKYAKAKVIKVVLEHDTKELKITIRDDGKGFDYEKLENSDYFKSSGHGIFNMKERIAFINGKFELTSKPGTGTEIKASIPLD